VALLTRSPTLSLPPLQLLISYGGKDVTEDFYGLHRVEVLAKYHGTIFIGTLAGEKAVAESDYVLANSKMSQVPYGEPSAFQGFPSPYYRPSHHAFRAAIREFLEAEVRGPAEASEESGEWPAPEVQRAIGRFGLLACFLGKGEHLNHVENGLPGGVTVDEFGELAFPALPGGRGTRNDGGAGFLLWLNPGV
jgi:hypothetical protein